MKILIIESDPPDRLAEGAGGAQPFVDTFARIAPDVEPCIAEPYARPLTDEDWRDVAGVVFRGSGVEWNTADARAEPLARAMRQSFDRALPVWGSCNGMQLAACVLGGAVGVSPNGFEGGLARDLTFTDAGAAHPMFAGREDCFAVPCVHRDEVTRLPEGACLLAGNDHSGVQAFFYARDGVDFWGSQYHPEYSVAHVADMLRAPRHGGRYADLVEDLSASGHDAQAAIRVGTTPEAQAVEMRARELVNWLAHVRRRRGQSDPVTFRFGDNPQLCDELLALVRSGAKRATCAALRYFSAGEPMPEMGRHDIATDWDGVPQLVIRTSEIVICRFDEVTEAFALAEGEADSLEGWRADHQRYFARNGGWDPAMLVVCERFDLVEDLRPR